MAFKRRFVVIYATHYDEFDEYHEVTFHERGEAVRFTRDHAYVLRSTHMEQRIIGHEAGFTLTDL